MKGSALCNHVTVTTVSFFYWELDFLLKAIKLFMSFIFHHCNHITATAVIFFLSLAIGFWFKDYVLYFLCVSFPFQSMQSRRHCEKVLLGNWICFKTICYVVCVFFLFSTRQLSKYSERFIYCKYLGTIIFD